MVTKVRIKDKEEYIYQGTMTIEIEHDFENEEDLIKYLKKYIHTLEEREEIKILEKDGSGHGDYKRDIKVIKNSD